MNPWKCASLAGALVLMTGVGALGGASPAAALELKLNGLHAPEHPVSLTHHFFADRVEQLTNGEITVDVFDARQLGDAVESVQSLRNGTIGFVTVSTSNLSQVVPQVDMFSLPYLFKSANHYWDYLNSERAEAFVKPLEDKGIIVLGWIDSGARNFFSEQPIRSVDDVQGKKIRVMASPVQVKTIEAMGGTGVPIAWGELYNALQTGVVDGAENNHPSVVTMKFYEVSDYYTLDEHARIPDALLMSKAVYDKLEPGQQQAIRQAGKEAEAYMRGAWTMAEQSAMSELQGRFTEIIEVDKQPFIEAVAPLVKEEAGRLGVTDEVSYILEMGQSY
ncbi:MAG TPA: TRAP transporter substrate-binding protein [Geminicoccaceae bacterium]|nr:TRAP transporter substrate-binding protein [Geminicoccaceae bacterium]